MNYFEFSRQGMTRLFEFYESIKFPCIIVLRNSWRLQFYNPLKGLAIVFSRCAQEISSNIWYSYLLAIKIDSKKHKYIVCVVIVLTCYTLLIKDVFLRLNMQTKIYFLFEFLYIYYTSYGALVIVLSMCMVKSKYGLLELFDLILNN